MLSTVFRTPSFDERGIVQKSLEFESVGFIDMYICTNGNGIGEGTHLSVFFKLDRVMKIPRMDDPCIIVTLVSREPKRNIKAIFRPCSIEQWRDTPIGVPCFARIIDIKDKNNSFISPTGRLQFKLAIVNGSGEVPEGVPIASC